MGLEAVLGLEYLLTEGAQLAARSSKQRQGWKLVTTSKEKKNNNNKMERNLKVDCICSCSIKILKQKYPLQYDTGTF